MSFKCVFQGERESKKQLATRNKHPCCTIPDTQSQSMDKCESPHDVLDQEYDAEWDTAFERFDDPADYIPSVHCAKPVTAPLPSLFVELLDREERLTNLLCEKQYEDAVIADAQAADPDYAFRLLVVLEDLQILPTDVCVRIVGAYAITHESDHSELCTLFCDSTQKHLWHTSNLYFDTLLVKRRLATSRIPNVGATFLEEGERLDRFEVRAVWDWADTLHEYRVATLDRIESRRQQRLRRWRETLERFDVRGHFE